jgi:DNA modification methylase
MRATSAVVSISFIAAIKAFWPIRCQIALFAFERGNPLKATGPSRRAPPRSWSGNSDKFSLSFPLVLGLAMAATKKKTRSRVDRLGHIAENLRSLAVRCDSLVLDPANARKHGDKNLEAIRGALRSFGQVKPLVVRKETGVVVCGNGTLSAARTLGWEWIAANVIAMDQATATALGIADNRTAELAEWDEVTLETLLASVQVADADLDAMFADLKADESFSAEGQCDPDDVPEPPDKAITQPGDVWVLGRHRLLCGDSSKATDVDRLLAGEPVHLVNTDPPYNVKVEPRSNNAIAAGNSSFKKTHHQKFDLERHPEKAKGTTKKMRAKDRPLANDFVSDEAFDKLLDAWFGNLARVLLPGHAFYIWGGYANLGNYPPVLKKHELYFSQGIVWDKEHPVLTRKDFMGAFEICFYGWRKGAGHRFFGPNNATDLWHLKKINPQAMIHLTEKPVELAARAMEYSSKPGENVLDLFGGSGSTMIAAEQTGRRAFLMELDPPYCDVIAERFESFTGTVPVRERGPDSGK